MRRHKASRPAAAERAREPRTKGSAGRQNLREAISSDQIMQALAVHAGQTCIGHLLPRGKSGVEAFDADDRSLGLFPDQKAAADAVSEAVKC